MDYVEPMDVFNTVDQLVVELAGFLLAQSLALYNVVEQLAALNELHHKEQVTRGLDDFVELDDVGVPDQLKNVDLSTDPFDVCHVHYLILLEDLDGNRLVSGFMRRQLHLTKGALTQCPPKAVVADLLLVGVGGGFG